jgi:hypothetical protein
LLLRCTNNTENAVHLKEGAAEPTCLGSLRWTHLPRLVGLATLLS